ncbi:MAG: type IV pilin protein [Pseudomonadales bacterium]|nr:type IV pilin protein [Pseudomonadales bacterium]
MYSMVLKSKQQGVTLMELMIALAIIAIIASVAIPNYQGNASKARRSDAQTALLGLASAMERYYTANNTYLGAAQAGDTGAPDIYPDEAPIDGDTKYYDLQIFAAAANTYELRAVPKGDQAGDGFLSLNSVGVRGWDMNNNGSSADAGENAWHY